jgi:hypothetical protein
MSSNRVLFIMRKIVINPIINRDKNKQKYIESKKTQQKQQQIRKYSSSSQKPPPRPYNNVPAMFIIFVAIYISRQT